MIRLDVNKPMVYLGYLVLKLKVGTLEFLVIIPHCTEDLCVHMKYSRSNLKQEVGPSIVMESLDNNFTVSFCFLFK